MNASFWFIYSGQTLEKTSSSQDPSPNLYNSAKSRIEEIKNHEDLVMLEEFVVVVAIVIDIMVCQNVHRNNPTAASCPMPAAVSTLGPVM